MKKIIMTILGLMFITASIYSYNVKESFSVIESEPSLYLDIGTTLQVLIDNEGTDRKSVV